MQLRSRNHGRWALAALAIMLMATASVQAQDKKGPPDSVVGVDTVAQLPMAQTVPVLGRLVPARAGNVAARIGGAIASFTVDVGDTVKKDQVIAHLVKDRLAQQFALRKAEVSQTQAALQTADAVVALREQELNRLQGLRTSAAFSQARTEDKAAEVIRAKSSVAEARAALSRAQANLNLAKIDLASADIRAPYAGAVSKRFTEVGAYVAVGQPVVSLIDGEHLEIEADVPGQRIAALKPGTIIPITLPDGTPADARVRAAIPEENPLTRTRTVRFSTPLKAGASGLAVNQSVTLSIPAGAATTVVSVHKDAVINRKGKTLVYVVEDGKANIRPVQLGEAVGTRFQVKNGLAVGDVVVVRGNERLRPGQAVRAAPTQ